MNYNFIILKPLSALEDFILFCRRDTVKISNIHFMLNSFFPPESYRILVNVENMVQPDRPHLAI